MAPRKKKLSLGADVAEAENGRPEHIESNVVTPVAGQWAQALKSERELILEQAQQLISGVESGDIPISIDVSQVTDEVGSDRSGEWQRDEEFTVLKDNLEARGQRQPIVVRPSDFSWQADRANPKTAKPDDRFILQSGRRRLQACRELGIPVKAYVVIPHVEDLELSDLEERYFENAMRQDLCAFDELVSIGMLVAKAGEEGEQQKDLAVRLGQSKAELSRAINTLNNAEKLRYLCVHGSVRELTKSIIGKVIPLLNKGDDDEAQAILAEFFGVDADGDTSNAGANKTSKPTTKKKARRTSFELPSGRKVKLAAKDDGLTISVPGLVLDGDQNDDFQSELTELLKKYDAA